MVRPRKRKARLLKSRNPLAPAVRALRPRVIPSAKTYSRKKLKPVDFDRRG